MIKKSLQDGYELIKKRRERLSESIKAHEETIVNYAQRMEELRRIVQALSARLAELQKAQKEGK